MKKGLYVVLSVLVSVYLTLRAMYVPLVHDEIATFFYYIQQIDVNPLAGANPDANNHILNSLLGGISHKYLGYSAFSIRLPNLLSFIFYAFFLWKIGQFLSNKWTQITFYVSLLFAVYFVQFFALSRGYGMSLAFLFGAFYYCISLYEKASARNVALGLLFMIMAVFSNMSLLPPVLLLAIVMLVLFLRKFKSYNSLKSYSWIIPSLFFWVIGMYYAIIISFKMKNEGSLYYGELEGFWDITVKSQLLMLFENDTILPQVLLFIGVLMLLIVYFNLVYKFKFRSLFNQHFFFFYLLVGSIIGIQLMAIILHVNYPEDRVGMYLIPLFIGSFCFGVDALPEKRINLILIPFIVFPFHFLATLNIDKSSLWQVEYIPERFYETIKNTKTNSLYGATVGGDGQRIFTYTQKLFSDTVSPKPNMMQLWQKTLFDSNLNINVPNHPAQYFDYLVAKPEYVTAILPLYDSIDYAEFTKFRLYKRKKTPVLKKLNEFITEKKNESSEEFIEFYHEYFDSLNYDAIQLGLQFNLQALSHPFRARVVTELKYQDGEQIDYQFFQLNWMYEQTLNQETIVQRVILNNLKHYLQKSPIEIKMYLWNINRKPYSLYGAKVEEFGVFDVE
jgi:MFS family permease